MNEDVMVVDASALAPLLEGSSRSLLVSGLGEILELIENGHRFIPRSVAETSPEWRQIIPYVVIDHAGSFYVLRRTRKQNEARLHDKLSLGIGGHINPGYDLASGLRKELEEEVSIDDPYELQLAGIVNDVTTEVGRVHLGVVYRLNASTSRVRVLEVDKMSGGWVPLEGLPQLLDQMESWSRIVCEQLLLGQPESAPRKSHVMQ